MNNNYKNKVCMIIGFVAYIAAVFVPFAMGSAGVSGIAFCGGWVFPLVGALIDGAIIDL